MKKIILSLIVTFFALSCIANAHNPAPPYTFKAKFDFKVNNCKVSFFDESAAGAGICVTSWAWDFGDGHISTLQHPTHIYAVSGIYKVCLTIAGVNAGRKKLTSQICVKVKVKACNPTHPCRLFPDFCFKADSCKLVFSDASVAGASTILTSWTWDFGDGHTSALQSPTHVYAISGVYTVGLTITGVNSVGEKCEQKTCKQVIVQGCSQTYPCQIAPKFNFRIDSCHILFFDFSVIGVGTTVTGWFWDFGDGHTSTLQNPAYVYGVSGMYNVCLTVTGVNSAGTQCKASICIMATVDECNRPSVYSERENASTAQLQVYPNPAGNNIQIDFNMATEGQAQVTVEDVQGRVLSVLQEGSLGVGYHNLVWRAGVSPGWYLIILKTDSGIEQKPILVE